MSKFILYSYGSNSLQKTARKNTKYSRNDTTLKIGHVTKSIAFAWAYGLWKMLNLGQNFKLPKTCQSRFCIHIGVTLCKKRLEKIPNIPEMR